MNDKELYFVLNISSTVSSNEWYQIHTSYELALKAMEERVSNYDETVTDVYLYCFLIYLDAPISEYQPIAAYIEGEWHISERRTDK